MNQNYVAVKVDGQERAGSGAGYMSAVQMMTGRGGWPMTSWLTPDRKPFYGGTYFPPRDGDRGANLGFLTLLKRLRQAYDQQPDKIARATVQISQAIQRAMAGATGADSLPGVAVLDTAFRTYESEF